VSSIVRENIVDSLLANTGDDTWGSGEGVGSRQQGSEIKELHRLALNVMVPRFGVALDRHKKYLEERTTLRTYVTTYQSLRRVSRKS